MVRDVTLREMLEAMAESPDDGAFRWLALADETLRVTLGQARRELGLTPSPFGRDPSILQLTEEDAQKLRQCPKCRGFGYTKGGPEGPWEKLTCEACDGTGKSAAPLPSG